MTIRIKFLFSVLAIGILISTAGVVIYQRTQQINKEIKKAEVAQKIIQVATTRRGLAFDYSRYHEERPKAQWQSLLNSQTILSQSELFDTPDEQSVLAQINDTSEQIKSLFAELVANYEKPKSSGAEVALSLELEQVLVTQLLIKVQANINRAYTLSDASSARVSTAQNTLVFAAGVSAAVLLFFLVALFFFFNQFIAKPLIELKESFLRISSLDFSATTTTTTTTGRKDELGMLSRAFNTMVVKLKESYATLEQKVHNRTQDLENEKVATRNVLEDLDIEKEKAENLANDLKKFKLALDNTSDMVVITDPEGMVVYANSAVETITGYKPEEAIGKKSGALWKSPMPQEYYKNFWHTIKEEKKTFVGEIQNRRKSDGLYTALISVSPVLNEKGDIVFFVGIERDVTKEREIDKAKDEFISLTSHQLRTPLTAINWYTEMLRDGDAGKLTKKQGEYFQGIYGASKQMGEIIQSFLHIIRLETGKLTLNPTTVDLVALAKATLGESKLGIEQKGLHITGEYQDALPPITVDKDLVHVVFQNLVTNAVKYTPEKGEITFSIHSVKKGETTAGAAATQDSLVVAVRNNGKAISPADHDKIFSKFFRSDDARRIDPNGNGIGLYMTKKMVDLIGGTIWFVSPTVVETMAGKEEGKGTTFYALLPLVPKKLIY